MKLWTNESAVLKESKCRIYLPVESPHRGELVVAVVTGGVAGVVFLVTGEGLGVVEHLGADITDIFCRVTVLETKPYK